MEQILDDHRFDGGNLGDLVTSGIGVVSQEAMTAACAALGLHGDDLVDLFHRNELERGALVARLASRRTSTGGLGRTRGSRRRIARGRLGGIPGVLIQARFQIQDPLVLLSDPFLKQSDLVGLRLQRRLESGDDLPARGMNLTLWFPSLHSLMEHERAEKDSSEVTRSAICGRQAARPKAAA
jgi:hypothetical protein